MANTYDTVGKTVVKNVAARQQAAAVKIARFVTGWMVFAAGVTD